jgi:hypothetical protein
MTSFSVAKEIATPPTVKADIKNLTFSISGWGAILIIGMLVFAFVYYINNRYPQAKHRVKRGISRVTKRKRRKS